MLTSSTASAGCTSSSVTPFSLMCRPGFSINRIWGNYNRHKQDRYFCIVCRYNTRRAKHCYNTTTATTITEYLTNSTTYTNSSADDDAPVLVQCDQHYYLNGVFRRNDGKFYFRCCRNIGQCARMDCRSVVINTVGGIMNYRVKNKEFIVGVSSSFDSDIK